MSAKKAIIRKTRAEAFEQKLSPPQLAQLYSWCYTSFKVAQLNAFQEWGLKVGIKPLWRWFHKDDSLKILAFIASGAHMNGQIEDAYQATPAPEVKTLVNLCKTLVMQLSVKGATDKDALESANSLFHSVLEFLKLEQKMEEFALAKDKFQFDASKAALRCAAELKVIFSNKNLSEADKVNAARVKLFGALPK